MRNKIIFIVGRTASILGTQLYNFVFALMVLYTTGSAVSFAVTIILETVPRILFGTVSGILADRYNRKKIIVFSDMISACVLFFSYFVFAVTQHSLVMVFILTFILNSINTFFDVTMNSSLEDLFKKNGLEQMCAINEGLTTMISLLAPLLGALIYSITNFDIFLIVNGISFFISAITEMFLEYSDTEIVYQKKKTIKEETLETLFFLKKEKVIFDLYFLAIFINIFYGIAVTLSLPIILTEYIGISEIQYGIVETTLSVGMFAGAAIFSFIRKEKKYKLIITSFIFEGIAILSISLPYLLKLKTDLFISYSCIVFILGVSISSVNINVRVLMQKLIPDKIKGKVLGTLSSMCLSMQPIAIMLASLYVDKHNPVGLVFGCGVLFVIMSVAMANNREMKKI